MRKLFTILACAAAMVACENDEIVRQDLGDRIEFGSFVENSTRATDPSYSANDITSFKVYGTVNDVLIFDDATVTKGNTQTYGDVWAVTDNDGKTINQYWIPGADYKFVGIVDGQKTGVTKTNFDGNKMPTTVEYTADGATDLLCETIVRNDNTNTDIVGFNFSHLLSKVNFTVVNGSKGAAGYSFVVKNITFNGATKATYNVVDAEWEDATETGNTLIGNNERTVDVDGVATKVKDIVVASGAASTELATEVLFIPGAYTITFTVDILYNGQTVTTTNYPATGTYTHTLKANNAYNFKVNVAVGQLIEFTVTQKPGWDNDDNDDGVNNDTTLVL